MLILGDEGHYHGRFPWVTGSLVIINVVVFLGQVAIGPAFTNGFSLIPEEIVTFRDLQGTKNHRVKIEVRGYRDQQNKYQRQFVTKDVPIQHYPGPFPIFLTLFTSMFLHGDVFHLIGNMWFLLVFGRNVECALSHGRFLAFYVACGVCAGLVYTASAPHSIVPCLGASGAISGVMGAYVAIHPLNRIKLWLGWFFGVVNVPALFVIGLWFLLQYVKAFMSLEDDTNHDGVAYWDHIGGFCAGIAIIRGLVWYLQSQHTPANDEDTPEPTEETPTVKPDPFATFLSVKTIREMDAKAEEAQQRSTSKTSLRIPAEPGHETQHVAGGDDADGAVVIEHRHAPDE